MMGTPKSLWPVNPIASGTDEASTNSMYAIPLDLLEFLSEIILTSLTCREKHRGYYNLYIMIIPNSALKKENKKPNKKQLTFPTAEKKSSRSRALILAASCMQKTVRASLSSGVRLSIGCLKEGKPTTVSVR